MYIKQHVPFTYESISIKELIERVLQYVIWIIETTLLTNSSSFAKSKISRKHK